MTGLPRAVQLGGDPGRFSEFGQLGEELAKLAHPACPDVDWLRVEQLCQRLFQLDGAQLQSMAAFALARSRLQGLPGMLEAIGLLEGLVAQWPALWPRQASAREAILCGLFKQLQRCLRSQSPASAPVELLDHLDARLARLGNALASPAPQALAAMQALRVQGQGLARRVVVAPSSPPLTMAGAKQPAPAQVMPLLFVAPPALPPPVTARQHKRRWRRAVLYGCALLFTLAVAGLLLNNALSGRPAASATSEARQPLSLGNLMLFEPGSALLKADADAALQPLLAHLHAHPGWLVVVTGHADTSGSADENQQLSRARAAAVGDWLRKVGAVPAGCLLLQGLADTQPLASNATRPGRSANRRVEIRLLPAPDAC